MQSNLKFIIRTAKHFLCNHQSTQFGKVLIPSTWVQRHEFISTNNNNKKVFQLRKKFIRSTATRLAAPIPSK